MQTKTAAFFDVDRTLLPRCTMERLFLPYLLSCGWLRIRDLARYAWQGVWGLRAVGGKFRGWHQNKQHLKYKDSGELNQLAAECFHSRIRPRISDTGRRAVEEHRRAGHLVVLLTGSLEPLARELGQELEADLVLAAQLAEEQGTLSGHLANQRPYGPEKARLVKELASRLDLDLDTSFAYGDHHSDVEVLATVGNPRAVNPDQHLLTEARRRGWPVLNF
jgi:HAD superfamily hydrolase (TIGR01490 family)